MAHDDLLPGEPFTDYSVFEGLFVRVLKPEGEFLGALRAAGFDPEKPRRRYPARVFRQALKVAARFVYPRLEEAQALGQLGRLFFEGFGQTGAGRVMVAARAFLNAEALIRRFPEQAAKTGSVQLQPIEEGDGVWRLVYHQPFPNPEFTAGLLQEGLRSYGTVQLVASRSDEFEILFRESKA